MGFSQAPGLPYSKLGIVEDGDAASQSIEKDKYIIWKGGNYFAKTDIQQGETFVVDTNLTAVTEGAINGLAEALSASLMLHPIGYDFTNQVDFTTVYQTASKDGIVEVTFSASETGYCYINIDTHVFLANDAVSSSGTGVVIPIFKGQQYKYDAKSAGTAKYIPFLY